jgi:hypothetical protein
MHGTKSSVLAGIAVSSVHVLAWIYFPCVIKGLPVSDVVRAGPPAIMAYVVEQSTDMDFVAVPEVKLAYVSLNVDELTQVRFDDAAQGDVTGVVATASAPRLTETCAQVCDPTQFAADAGLAPGQSVTVVLVIDVLADGSTGATDVAMTSGSSAADAIAIRYARSLRWIPGTRNRQALSMRIRFPVTLARDMS